ncbi:MAG: tagaturonate epimerase family protein [Candidatus Methylacidiphilales bacterium]|nr:tagaturonate epimerase family protein [Candidatus Methylacidiphilales bacterium]
MDIQPYTIGMGDRFGHQGHAQLSAVVQANAAGIRVHPTWNKSNREHTIIGTKPDSLRAEADEAVKAAGWTEPYYVDADHINLNNVEGFLAASNFFTIDVADYSGKPAEAAALDAFVQKHTGLTGSLQVPGIDEPIALDEKQLRAAAEKFLWAIQEAGRIYRHIEAAKGKCTFVTEVSVDETDRPQTPVELLLILAMIADEKIPVQTIAPKFTGRFNKGVDYVGDIVQFEKEFDQDLAILTYAVKQFGLPETLKLSVHSGSDKFSLYPIIRKLIRKHGAGLHVKTAGTTWLEEVIGLAESGGDALQLAKDIYTKALPHYEELVKPYAPVVDIDPAKLPTPEEIAAWDSETYVATLRHDAKDSRYNLHFRQFIHVSFKIAAKLGTRYTEALKAHADVIGRNVTHNLLERHIRPIFSAE